MELIHRLSLLDQRLFLRMTRHFQRHWLAMSARIVSKTGDGYLQLLLPLGLVLAEIEGSVHFFKYAALAFLLERSLYWVLKNTLKRPRPPAAIPSFSALIKASDEFSFPSGHTSGAFLLATLFMFYLPVVGLFLFGWAMLVGLSRLVLGVHFPADILAGATLGTGIGWYISTALII